MSFMISLLFILASFTLSVNSEECRILVLSGGGAHGAFQVGVLDRINKDGYKWDVITGISVGSLNSIFLSGYKLANQTYAIKMLKDFWFNIKDSDVYTKNWNPIWSGSVYDNAPLNKTIGKALRNVGSLKRDVIVGATRVNDGRLDIFNRTELNSFKKITNVLMASTAIPVYFPPKKFGDYYYMDGGLFTNELIYPAVRTCREMGKIDIVINVIRCSRPIDNIPSKDIASYNIFKLAYRTYELASNTLLHHELYSSCSKKNFLREYPMYIYQPQYDFPGGLLDFSHDSVIKAYKMGLNITKPIKVTWCH